VTDKARKASLEALDNEFVIEVVNAMGPRYRHVVDASKARLFRSRGPGNYGFSVMPDASDEGLEASRARLGPDAAGRPLEKGHVYATGGEKATADLWAHEFRHVAAPLMSESMNRLEDGRNASSKGAWERAVKFWEDDIGEEIYGLQQKLKRELNMKVPDERAVRYYEAQIAAKEERKKDPEASLIKELVSLSDIFSEKEQAYEDRQQVPWRPGKKKYMHFFERQPKTGDERKEGGSLEAPWVRWANERKKRDGAQ
jgi:hypothetical protein